MKHTAIGAVLMLMSGALAEAQDATLPTDLPRRVGVLAGVGAAVGGVGAGVEAYVAKSRVSVFGGAGYIPSSVDTSVAGGGGLRVFTGGRRHRGFAEAALLPVGTQMTFDGHGVGQETVIYGPSFSLGYQYMSPRGVTFMVSAGAAHAVNELDKQNGIWQVATIAVGHTWPRAR